MRKINVGLIGHKFMGKAHSHALRDVAMFFDAGVEPVMKTLCGVGDDLDETARRYGWQSTTQRWRDVIEDPQIDAVSILTPGVLHCEMALAAAAAGKHIVCEKPLALNTEEAARMYAAAEAAGVVHMVNFNYRRVPAVAFARQLIEEGRLGTIYHFRGAYQQDWPLEPEFPFIWRFDKKVAGAGSMADKGSHVVDLARYLVGEFAEVSAATDIFVKERNDAGAKREVTTDDAAVFTARFRSGALGLFLTSRMSAGHKNSLAFEVNGSKGSLAWDLERPNELQVYYTGGSVAGFQNVMVTESSHPYVGAWWPPGHVLGWEHTFIHQYYEFLKGIAEKRQPEPSFLDGLRNHEVLDAIEQAAAERRWVDVPRAKEANA
jgi:predicted dehydrogenase